jgi:hypothetical protein
VWTYQGKWIAKLFKDGWYPYHGYETFEIQKPNYIWRKNPDLDRSMTFDQNLFSTYEPNDWEHPRKLIWYIDKRFNPLEDEVWAFSCEPADSKPIDTKTMGYVTPSVTVEVNQYIQQLGLDIDVDSCCPAYWELTNECAYELDPAHQTDERLWVIKFVPNWRRPKEWKWMGTISPTIQIVYNPDLPELNYSIEHSIPWHDLNYEHVWMLDRSHLTHGEEDIWAFKMIMSNSVVGSKIVDYITPDLEVVYNPDLPDLNYNVEYHIPWHDLNYEHVWMLDRSHLTHGEEDIWAFKMIMSKNVVGSKIVDYITPDLEVVYNPDLPELNYSIEYHIPWHDLNYEHMWMLDKKHTQSAAEPIWAVRVCATSDAIGTKIVSDVSPVHNIKYNNSIKALELDPVADHIVQHYDFEYENVWYTMIDNEKIWVAKLSVSDSVVGTKEVAVITPNLPDRLDVIFISYGEPNAETNWNRVLEKAPHAKRITGVAGILEAHRAAAKLSNTNMFYVVDGDAYLFKSWEFNFVPGVFDQDCTYIWSAKNPLVELTYGHGGVKLFAKSKLLKLKKWRTLDMTTSVSEKIKVMSDISNWTAFNTDNYSTWRTVFRECVKLSVNMHRYPDNPEHQLRLDKWKSVDAAVPFGNYAKDAHACAVEFVNQHVNNYEMLMNINDRSWLEETFKKTCKVKQQ